MNTLEQWTITVCADLGIDAATVDTKAVLGLAREVAHSVDRPAAPLSAYLVGVAVGRGLTPAEAIRRVLALVGPGLPDSYGGLGRARAAAAVPYT